MSKVYVGMSGGVDSSVTAALLVEAGHNVTGVYMKNWTQDLANMRCPWAEDLADAKRIAVQLGIDLKVYDFEKEYKSKVVDYMVSEYRAGRTPNPDIMCNQEVKFKLFLETALEDGAEMIATGHYARVVKTPEYSKLLRAKDENKDQTYFLYRISGDALAKTLFPIGEYTKPEVRQMALDRGLYTANKKDSQGICFVGKVGIKDFLGQYIDSDLGNVIDKKTGKVIGTHDGAIFYTVGQRHGLDIGGGLPYYVVGKDIDKNEVIVSTDLNDEAFWKQNIHLNNIHWINNQPSNGQYQVRVRHRAKLIPAELEVFSEGGALLTFENPERSINPGQSVVLYSEMECLGGGIVV